MEYGLLLYNFPIKIKALKQLHLYKATYIFAFVATHKDFGHFW